MPGGTLPNRAAYKANPKETQELQRQVEGLFAKGLVRGKEKAKFVKDLHVQVQKRIKRKGEQVALRVNKGHKKVVFQPRDWVWVHFRKIHFPDKTKGKLAPRGDGPFLVLERVNDNAYIIHLPRNPDLRTNPSQKGEDVTNLLRLEGWPMTRSMTRRSQEGLSNLIQKVVQDEASRPKIPAMKHVLSADAVDPSVWVALIQPLYHPDGCHK
ncbi:hypothetical protein AAHA92_25035 [Salvia divinorum]|uniref:Tf2-1-like SH3-like domain-containing protein n=1 Tax=Salvia divinorum TaxID=28513 RepID=A0ABD1GCF1_SALDI